MNQETSIDGAGIVVSKLPRIDETIAHLAWEVEQPNSHPLCLYEPLILAIGRRLAKNRSRSRAQARMLRYADLPAPEGEQVVDGWVVALTSLCSWFSGFKPENPKLLEIGLIWVLVV